MNLRCTTCSDRHNEAARPTLCARCGGVLLLERPTGAHLPAAPIGPLPGLWRYAARIHAGHQGDIVTLGEGWTPVVALPRWGERVGLHRVFAKLEFFAPTGSFKDRGAAVMVTRARELGAGRLVEDSSGNAGASVAAYAARAGLPCTIYAPAAAPPAKLKQITAAGATLVLAPGPREAVAEAAMADDGGDAYYAGHNRNPYFIEGTRTFAFEVADQFEMQPPEHLIMPVGGGSLYFGAWLGFSELHAAGQIAGMPRLHLAQADGCAPLVAAVRAGADDAVPVPRTPTIAGGVTIEQPARGQLLLSALRNSGGTAVAVDDTAIIAEQRALARLEGLACEPTAAVAFAALARLAALGAIDRDDGVLVAVTGSALKDSTGL